MHKEKLTNVNPPRITTEPIFGGQHFANFLIPAKIILVANRLAIIVHSVENDMAMRMLTVDMPGNDVLRVFDVHQFHIVLHYLPVRS